MALGAVRAGTASTGATTPRSPALPASVASGELLVLVAAIEGTSCSVTTPSGYTLQANAANGTTVRSYIFTKIAGGSESAPSVTSSGTSRMQIFAIPGAHATTPVSQTNTGSGSSTSAAVSALSDPGTRGAMLMQAVCSSVAGTAMTSDWRMKLLAEGNSGGTTTANCRGGIAIEAGMSEDAPTPASRAMTVGSGTWASADIWIVPATAATFGLRQSAKAASSGTAVNTLTATLPANGLSGSFLIASVSDWYWLTSGFVNSIDYNGGLNFTKLFEQSTLNSAELVSLWYYQNNAQTASAPAAVTHQSSADTAAQSILLQEYVGITTTGTPYEANATAAAPSDGTTATVTSGTTTSGQRLMVSAESSQVGSSFVGDTDYTMRWLQGTATTNWQGLVVQDREMAGGGTDTVTVTWTSASNWVIGVAAFLPPGGTTQTITPTGTLTSAGALAMRVNKPLAGTLTSAGALTRKPTVIYVGTLTSAGALKRQANKPIGGTLTTAGALTPKKVAVLALAGTLTTAGALTRRVNKALGGTLTTAGALTRKVNQNLAGTLTSSGALTRKATKALAGTLTTAGALTVVKLAVLAVGGTLTTAGTLIRQANLRFTGTLTSAGALIRQAQTRLGGTLTTAGSLATSTGLQAISVGGTLTTAGTLTRRAQTSLSGTLTTSGALIRQVNKKLAGTLTSAGALATLKLVFRSFGGTLTTAGALKRQANKALGGTLTTAGNLIRRPNTRLSGTLTSAGGLIKTVIRRFTGTFGSSGTLTPVQTTSVLAAYAELVLDARTATVTMDLRAADVTMDLRAADLAINQRTADVQMDRRTADVTIDIRRGDGAPDERRALITI